MGQLPVGSTTRAHTGAHHHWASTSIYKTICYCNMYKYLQIYTIINIHTFHTYRYIRIQTSAHAYDFTLSFHKPCTHTYIPSDPDIHSTPPNRQAGPHRNLSSPPHPRTAPAKAVVTVMTTTTTAATREYRGGQELPRRPTHPRSGPEQKSRPLSARVLAGRSNPAELPDKLTVTRQGTIIGLMPPR